MNALLSFIPALAESLFSGRLVNSVKEFFANPRNMLGAASQIALDAFEKHSPKLLEEAREHIKNATGFEPRASKNFTPVSAPVAVSEIVTMSHKLEKVSENEALIIGCEPIVDVTWPYALAADELGGCIDINPATWVGTRACAACMPYTRYRFEHLVYRFVPRSGTQVPGTISFGTISESPLEKAGTLSNQLLASPGGLQTPVWKEAGRNVNVSRYGMNNYPLDDFSAEPKSPLRIAWSTDLSAITSLGTLWVSYRIRVLIGRSPMSSYATSAYQPYVFEDGQTPNLKHVVLWNGSTFWSDPHGQSFQGVEYYFNGNLTNLNAKSGVMVRMSPYQRVEMLPSGVYAVTYRVMVMGEDVTELCLRYLATGSQVAKFSRFYTLNSLTAGTFSEEIQLMYSLLPGDNGMSRKDIAEAIAYLRLAAQSGGGVEGCRQQVQLALRDRLKMLASTAVTPFPGSQSSNTQSQPTTTAQRTWSAGPIASN